MAALIQSENRSAIFFAFVGGLGVLYGVIYGPLAAFWSELFDTRYRYTALSALYQISGIVASGLTPLIAAWLVSRGDGSLWLVSAYAVVVAAISLVSARLLPETAGRDLDEAWKETPCRSWPSRQRPPTLVEAGESTPGERERRWLSWSKPLLGERAGTATAGEGSGCRDGASYLPWSGVAGAQPGCPTW